MKEKKISKYHDLKDSIDFKKLTARKKVKAKKKHNFEKITQPNFKKPKAKKKVRAKKKHNFEKLTQPNFKKPKAKKKFIFKNPAPKEKVYNEENFRAKLKLKVEIVAGNVIDKYKEDGLNNEKLVNSALNLFDYAVNKANLKPNDLGRNRGAPYLSILLIYYALIDLEQYKLGNDNLTGKLVAKSVEDYSQLGFKTRKTMENHINIGKFYGFLPKAIQIKKDNLAHFKNVVFDNEYRSELVKYLEIALPELLNFYSISELKAESVRKSALEIFDYAINNGMTQKGLSIPYSSNKLTLILITYALLDLGIKSLGITSLGQADIGKALVNVYDRLNFSNTDSMIYLKTKIIYDFLPDRLKKLLDSLPSPKLIVFNQFYNNELKKYLNLISEKIILKYSISVINLDDLVETALTLYNHALENKLTPDDLKKNQMPNQLALMLIYFSLIHHEIYILGEKIISVGALIDAVENFEKLDFKNKNSIYNIYPTYLLPFFPEFYRKRVESLEPAQKIHIEYDHTFRKKLEGYIRSIITKILNKKSLNGITTEKITRESIRLFDFALKNDLNPEDLGRYRFARYLSIGLIYLSLVSLNVISLGQGALSVRDINDIIAEDYEKLGFGSEEAMRFDCSLLNKYIPMDILDKVDRIPQTKGIVFNEDYFNDLENYVEILTDQVKEHYNLNIDINDLTSLSIKIFEDCIRNGLEPKDLGDNKSASFMSIILLYYALITSKNTTLGTGTITLSKIVDLLSNDYEQIGFSSFWFSDKVSAGRLYSFLPQNTKKVVALLPERELPIGKYESICKEAFNVVLSELYNKKIKIISHLSLYKLVSDGKNNYISEYIKRAHVDFAAKVPLPKRGINKRKHRFHMDIDIPTNINEVEYKIDHIESFEIQEIIEKIKKIFAKNDIKLVKIQFPIGHIKILIRNDTMFLFEREIHIPLCILNENLIWFVHEYNGKQHYIFPNYYHKDLTEFIKGIINDFLKIYLLFSSGRVFFEFPYWISPKMNEPNKIRDFISEEIKSSLKDFQ